MQYVSWCLTSDLQDGVVLPGVLGVVSLQQTAARGGARASKLRHVQISKAQLRGSHTYRPGWHWCLFISTGFPSCHAKCEICTDYSLAAYRAYGAHQTRSLLLLLSQQFVETLPFKTNLIISWTELQGNTRSILEYHSHDKMNLFYSGIFPRIIHFWR